MDTPKKTGSQMSSSLKERLKRCGRYHASPKPLISGTRHSVRDLHHSKTWTETSQSPLRQNSENVVKQLPQKEVLLKTGSDKQQLLNNQFLNENLEVEIDTPVTKKGRLNTKTTECRSSDIENCSSLLVGQSSPSCPIDKEHSKTFHTPLTSMCSKPKSVSKLDAGNRKTVNDTMCIQEKLKDNGIQNRTVGLTDVGEASIDTTDTEHHTEVLDTDTEHHTEVLDSDSKTHKQCIDTIRENEEVLRKLRMVKMYRSKNDLIQLQGLIDKWRNVSQQALYDLHESMSEPKPTLTQLVNHLGIDHTLIQFDVEEESFG